MKDVVFFCVYSEFTYINFFGIIVIEHKHYTEYLDLRDDGRIVIYKRKEHKNPTFTARLKIPRRKGYIARATGSQDLYEARRLRSVLRFAFDREHIKKMPQFPKFKSVLDNARPDFTRAEWRQLYEFMRKNVKDAKGNAFHHRARFYLQQYVLILANSGIRVGEARKLRWCDISQAKTLDDKGRVVLSVSGKTGKRDVVCNEGVEKYLSRLYEHRKKELGKAPLANNPVFCSKDGNATGSYRNAFNSMLERSGLLHNSDGETRTIYSLRHTYATMQIQEGVEIYGLANNMGTSVEMIERYYGKKRNTTAKAASEITKMAARDRSTNKDAFKLPWG